MPDKTFCLQGCGGHARSVADVLLFNNPETKILFADKNAKEGEKIMGFDCLCTPPPSCVLFPAVGDNLKRKEFFKENTYVPNIVSKDAYLAPTASLGQGNFIAHSAHIGPLAKIGNGCIINTKAAIEHESIVGHFTHISVHCTVCGRCKIGDNVFLGAGSVVKDGVHICDDVIIGAGSVVIRNIDHAGTYVGCPVRKIK